MRKYKINGRNQEEIMQHFRDLLESIYHNGMILTERAETSKDCLEWVYIFEDELVEINEKITNKIH